MTLTTEPGAPPPPPPPPPTPLPTPSPRRPRTLLRVVALVAAALLTVVALAGIWVERQVNPSGHPGSVIDFTVAPGSSTHQIADDLAKKGVISHPLLFRIYLRFHHATFRAGTYSVHRHESYGAAIRELEGNVVSRAVTIPEGFTLVQVAARVGALPGHSASAFLAAARSGAVHSQFGPAGSDNLEGLLFPDTYSVAPGESDTALLAQMVHRFDQVAAQIGLASAAARVGVTPYQAVVVASMIEREAKVPADRPLVAEVVYNRLHKDMRLQIDATVLYALGPGQHGLTASQLRVGSPYNTYLHTGLPPGPIAAPGRLALEAALSPAVGDYLYYVVVSPDGKEAFSATLAGHERNIALARSRGLPG